MLPADAYAIREATAADSAAVGELAVLDEQAPLEGTVLVADVAGLPTAAMSLDDGRVVADPFQDTATLVAILRAHAAALAKHGRPRNRRLRPLPGRAAPAAA